MSKDSRQAEKSAVFIDRSGLEAMRDFSGLVSSACAFASAAAMVPIDSLELCTIGLQAEHIKTYSTGF